MKIIMKVSNDKYQLPELIGKTCAEIARADGVDKSTVTLSVRQYRKGTIRKPKYIEVEIEDDEDDEWELHKTE